MAAQSTMSLKISPPLHTVLHYVGVVRGGLSPRRVGEEVLIGEIEKHPVGAQMLSLVHRNLGKQKKETHE